jgi:shikimate dehydrogenase
MPLYGIIGFPLLHSASQPYFREKFRREGLTGCDYEVFPLQHISEFPTLIAKYPHLAGLNVTIPHKEAVLQYVHEQDAVVEACGAANCLKIHKGNIKAYNTDAIGFERSLTPLLQPHHTRALILGTGGAAKAVAWVLKKQEIPFLFVTRQPGKQNNDTIGYEAVDETIMKRHTLIINASPAGMLPDAGTCPPINYSLLSASHLLYDLVYKPEKTLFLQKGEARGAFIKNGYEMLVLQAEAGWAIWQGT